MVPLAQETKLTTEIRGLWLRPLFGILVFLFLLAAITSFSYSQRFQDYYEPDSSSYIVPATNMLMGYGFIDNRGYPETTRTPGYPLLIMTFLCAHLSLKSLIFFQHLLRILIILAASVLGYQATRSRMVAATTGVLLCFDLPLLESANALLTEILFTIVLLGILWLLWKEPEQEKPGIRCLAAGFFAGASVLIRPVSILFFIPAAAYLWIARSKFKLQAALSFSSVFLCIPVAWATRNYYETGAFAVSSISGVNMLLYRAAGVLAINDPGDFNRNLQERQTQVQMQACEGIEKLYKEDCSQVTIPQRTAYYGRLGRSIILAHPLAYAKLFIRGEIQMIFNGNMIKVRKISRTGPHLARLLLVSYTVPVFCLAVTGLSTLWSANRRLFLLILLTSLYFLIISGGAEVYSRFRVPIDPVYILAAAIGLDALLKRVITRNAVTNCRTT